MIILTELLKEGENLMSNVRATPEQLFKGWLHGHIAHHPHPTKTPWCGPRQERMMVFFFVFVCLLCDLSESVNTSFWI